MVGEGRDLESGTGEAAPSPAPRVPRNGKRGSPQVPDQTDRPSAYKGAREMFRFLGLNILLGALVGEAALGILYWTDTFGIASVIRNAANPWLPLGILAFMFALTFAAAVTATAVLTMPYEPKDDAGEE